MYNINSLEERGITSFVRVRDHRNHVTLDWSGGLCDWVEPIVGEKKVPLKEKPKSKIHRDIYC